MRFALKSISIVSGLVSLFSAWLFYDLYWQWRTLFEGGRHFDPINHVVYNDSAAFFMVPVLFLQHQQSRCGAFNQKLIAL
jgi:predicted Co/Zn/Cd cation transporter (cation efflux family)